MNLDDVGYLEDFPSFVEGGTPLCSETDPDMFFTEQDDEDYQRNTTMAKTVCGRCVYKVECLEWAMESREMGVWGGTSDLDRRQLRRKNRSSL